MRNDPGSVLPPDGFTSAFVSGLMRTAPGWTLQVRGPLQVTATDENGRKVQADLSKSYRQYCESPQHGAAILAAAARALLETTLIHTSRVDRARVVPVIKPRAWLEQVLRAQHNRGAEIPPLVYLAYNAELSVLYAEDNPSSMRFINHDDLHGLSLTQAELHALAVPNLRNVLPDVALRGGEGVYMVSAGGNYEPSLILVDSFWESRQIAVEGDYVVALPARGILAVTGSGNPKGLSTLRGAAVKFSDSPNRISAALFIYRDGRFEVFDG